MTTTMRQKICSLAQLSERANTWRRDGLTIAHCHGCFDLVHPGHLRYLEFAATQADILVVSLTGDDAIEKSDGTRPYIPQELRAENLAAIELVDAVVIIDADTGEPAIDHLRPDIYIKGKEYECSDHPGFLAERQKVEATGGRVLFSSGDVVFSSTRLIEEQRHLLNASGYTDTDLVAAACKRWSIDRNSLGNLIRERFPTLRVAVIGDLLADRYAFCEQGRTTDEAPILTVRPSEEQTYLGGAGIIAAHLQSLGAQTTLFTSTADDPHGHQLTDKLIDAGIDTRHWHTRHATPSKLRYLVDDHKVFRVEQGGDEPLDSAAQDRLIQAVLDQADNFDALIVSDFGFGVVTPSLLAKLIPQIRNTIPIITGDVSGIRRGLLAMHAFDLLTPNEREARGAVGDFESSLPTLAGTLMRESQLANLIVTLGRKGSLLFRPRETDRSQWYNARLRCDYLPTLAGPAIDPLGAGDALLAVSTLALASDQPLPVAGYLGSAAAAVTVSRMGNHAVRPVELLRFLDHRPELHPASDHDLAFNQAV
ncbi:MAG: PfkB family carbohydrate kinase [Phycisphaeraceae bacterium]